MQYVSTRASGAHASGAQAIVSGLAAEGGLYVAREIPRFGPQFLSSLLPLDYPARAARVLAPWLDDFSEPALEQMCRAAYARFDDARVAPIKRLSGGRAVLELWHGPTLAFKDMALQLLPRLMTASGELVGEKREILILVATSGDTGKAALEGFSDVPGVRICVFFPDGGVSEAQKLQMVTQEGANTRVVAVNGNFDDAQTGVKQIFTDPEKIRLLDQRGIVLSSANSINLGRLVPQIAYYVSAYADLVASGTIKLGENVNICVPTGNFGNILAALYAGRMGLPLGKLICASNSNNVLTDFIKTGVYDRNRAFRLTTSPSMDILISSNLERLLYDLAGQDDGQVRAWMGALAREGRYSLDGAALDALHQLMYGGWASEEAVADEIKRTLSEDKYLIDPHTAVAMRVLRTYREETGDDAPVIIASTASPFKFGRSVLSAIDPEAAKRAPDDFACCDALAARSGSIVPDAIASLRKKPIRHRAQCAIDGMWDALGPLTQ
ncbi:MAG: threonine synthase [Clostridia bacterium]